MSLGMVGMDVLLLQASHPDAAAGAAGDSAAGQGSSRGSVH